MSFTCASHISISVSLSNPELCHNLLEPHAALVGNQTHQAGADVAELVVVVQEADVVPDGFLGVRGSVSGGRKRMSEETRKDGKPEEVGK